jgi:hypothetical protein
VRRTCVAAALLPALLASPARAGEWSRYEIIMWHTDGPARLDGARRLGVTAGMVFGVRDATEDVATVLAGRVAPLRRAGLGVYVGNIATDFYAPYHRWQPDRGLTWRFDQARARHAAVPADTGAFLREPGLSDPAALARVAARVRAHVLALAPIQPLYYSLGDETGIADLAAAWDFDVAPASLAAMRVWLRGQYGALAALNAEWDSAFATWDAVTPLLTDAALRRADGNFAAWADFKAWMDTAFAAAVRAGTDAAHAADPSARAGIEGAQAPGWGGYDYTRLAPAVDVLEIAGGEPAQDIAQALNPALVTLTTTAGGGAAEANRLWHAALTGGRGVILWDPDATLIGADGRPGLRWAAVAGVLADLRGEAGAALLASRPAAGPVGVLYSPASFRTQWIRDRQADTGDWALRGAEAELTGNAWRDALRRVADGLAHAGLQPRWLTPESLSGGGLAGLRAVILPHALALSGAEVAAIRAFAAGGGTVLADIPAGAYDAHSRRRAAPPLADVVTLLPGLPRAALRARLAAAGVVPGFAVAGPDGAAAGDVTIQVRRLGAATLLAVQRDYSEIPTEDVVLTLPRPMQVRDLRGGAARRLTRLRLRLDAVTPALLTLADAAG